MTAPYEKTVQVTADSAQANHVAIPFIHRGRINKVLVKQLDGVDAGFRFDLYNSRQPMIDNSQSSAVGDEVAPDIDHLAYQIIPTQNVAAGPLTMFTELGDGYEYRNVDGTYSVPQRFVYVRLEPHGTGPKTYQITLCGVPPEL